MRPSASCAGLLSGANVGCSPAPIAAASAPRPAVLSRVEVPFDIRLDRLHLTIQAAMGWTNSHLYEIRAGNVGCSTPYPDQDWAGDFLDARKARARRRVGRRRNEDAEVSL